MQFENILVFGPVKVRFFFSIEYSLYEIAEDVNPYLICVWYIKKQKTNQNQNKNKKVCLCIFYKLSDNVAQLHTSWGITNVTILYIM